MDGQTLHPLSPNKVIELAEQADVVLVGEIHSNKPGLAAATALWEAIAEARPSASLALEFIARDQQIRVDDWLAQEQLTVPEGFSFAHGPMMLVAKREQRVVIAANSPRRYVRLARTKGYEYLAAMTPAQRATFALPRSEPGGYYRERFFELFSGGGHGSQITSEQIEEYWNAQILWDSTMADSVINAVEAGLSPVLLMVGRFHIERNGGLLQFIALNRPELRVATIVMATESQVAEYEKSVTSQPIADVIWIVGE